MKKFKVILTEDDLQAIETLMDLALRGAGANALQLVNKLVETFRSVEEVVDKPMMDKE